MDAKEILDKAIDNARRGVLRYSIVTSGRRLGDKEIDQMCRTIRKIKETVNIEICVSFGLLDKEQFVRLRDAGVSRVHNNLETSRKNLSLIHIYPQEEFSEFEAKKWNKKLSKELKRPRRKKYASIAACAVICMALLAAGPFREQVKAAMNSAIDSLNEWLAMDIIDRDVSPYTNVINTSVKDDKIDVRCV